MTDGATPRAPRAQSRYRCAWYRSARRLGPEFALGRFYSAPCDLQPLLERLPPAARRLRITYGATLRRRPWSEAPHARPARVKNSVSWRQRGRLPFRVLIWL